MTMTTRLFSFFHGKFVGKDQFGNRYYTERGAKKKAHAKRWVIYNGRAEPSKVTPEWHGWLHYTQDTPPTERTTIPRQWEQAPIPNLTGTKGAYLPPGHISKGGNRAPTTADYEAWKP